MRFWILAGLVASMGCVATPGVTLSPPPSEPVASVVEEAPAEPPVRGQGMRIDIHTLPTPPHVLHVDADGEVDLAQLMTVLSWAQRTPILVDPAVEERVVLSGVMHLPGMADALRDVDIVHVD